ACGVLGLQLLLSAGCGGDSKPDPGDSDKDQDASVTGSRESSASREDAGGTAAAGRRASGTSAGAAAAASGEAGRGGSRASDGEPNEGDGAGGTGGAPNAGEASGGGQAPAADGGATGATGATGASGTGGTSGAEAAAEPSGPVEGRFVDGRQHPVPEVTVRLDDQTAKTDAEGRFRFASAPTTYTLVASLTAEIYPGVRERTVLQVEGLTRRDPTLQVQRALPARTAQAQLVMNNVAFPLPANQHINIGWTSPDAAKWYTMDSPFAQPEELEWFGPNTSTGTVHALHVEVDEATQLPTRYLAYDSKPLALQVGQDVAQVELDLAPYAIPTGAVSGTIRGALQNRWARLYLRNDAYTALGLLEDSRVVDTFSYPVPRLGGSEITVVVEGHNNGLRTGMSAAFVDHVAPEQSGLALELPNVPVLIAPAAGATDVDGSSRFEWQSEAKVVLLCAAATESYDTACVLTDKSTASLPFAPKSDFVPAASTPYGWTVEVHGAFASVDEACGPDGGLSAYASGALIGNRRGSGSYAISGQNVFTTKP
ncbi:MAG: carboxypeptidase-like regulatory domain-containing protein, partial [Polyangiales bacterium]